MNTAGAPARIPRKHRRAAIAFTAGYAGVLIAGGQAACAPRKHALPNRSKHAPPDRTRFHLAVLCEDENPEAPCPLALNDHGQVVGAGGAWKVRPFAALPGLNQAHGFGEFPRPRGCREVEFADMNNRGQIVGVFQSTSDGAYLATANDGFVWRRGKITHLKPIDTIPHAINNKGEIAGEHTEDMPPGNSYPSDAVVWRHGKVFTLGPGIAVDINDSGTVVGNPANSDEGLPVGRALCWRGGHVTELRALASGESRAWAINSHDLIVGNSDVTDTITHAVAWRNGRLIDLGAGKANSRALDVNDRDLIVGASRVGGEDHAVMWRDGKMIDLNRELAGARGWTLTQASWINARGQIIAQAVLQGTAYYVLLTPYQKGG